MYHLELPSPSSPHSIDTEQQRENPADGETRTVTIDLLLEMNSPPLSALHSSKTPMKSAHRRVKFNDRTFSISTLESLGDKANTRDGIREILLSLPKTLNLSVYAAQIETSNPELAVQIYDCLITKSCLLDNSTRKLLLDSGGGKRFLCTSKNPRRAKSLENGNFRAKADWLLKYKDECIAESCSCYQCAALSGDKQSQTIFGVIHSKGFIAEKDHDAAEAWWLVAQPDADAALCLAQHYEIYAKNREKAFDMYQISAELGNCYALYELGLAYLDSEGLDDPEKAFEYFTIASEKGHALSHLELGNMLSRNEYLDEEPKEAFFHFLKAAEKGIAEAQWLVAQACETGYGTDVSMEKALVWYLKAAENGHPGAQRTLGYFYEVGIQAEFILQQNFQKALIWYENAAIQKDSLAMFNLSNMFSKGRGTEKNIELAIYWCTEAARLGETVAQLRVAELHYQRFDVELKDDEKMIYWMDRAATSKNPRAQYLLGKFYHDGLGIEKDFEQAFALFQESAYAGDSSAQLALANMYRLGEYAEVDDAMSFSWCLKSAKQNKAEAITLLGRLYDTGKGCKLDPVKAVELYQDALLKGDFTAAFYLGSLYQYGSDVVSINLGLSFEYYIKAAEHDESRAQTCLGLMYKNGIYVDRNYETSASWFKKAAEQNNPIAQWNLGIYYEYGLGISKSIDQAVKYYFKAAHQNNTNAQVSYGLLIQKGTGVQKDDEEAVRWFQKASKSLNYRGMYYLARAYEDGVSLVNSMETALDLYEKATRGCTSANLRLFFYFLGKNNNLKDITQYLSRACSRDCKEAKIYYSLISGQVCRDSCETCSEEKDEFFDDIGHSEAEDDLQLDLYRNSVTIENSIYVKKILGYYRNPETRSVYFDILFKTAEKGSEFAKKKLIDHLIDLEDFKLIDFFECSTIDFDEKAAYYIAKAYKKIQNNEKYFQFLIKSANMKYEDAMIDLALEYVDNLSVDQGLKWLTCAANCGSLRAVEILMNYFDSNSNNKDVYFWCKVGFDINSLQFGEKISKYTKANIIEESELFQDEFQSRRKVLAWKCFQCMPQYSIWKDILPFIESLSHKSCTTIRKSDEQELFDKNFEELGENFDFHTSTLTLYKAAKKGDYKLAFILGYMLCEGIGCDKSVQYGIHWLQVAADNNHMFALKKLINLFSKGESLFDFFLNFCYLNQLKGFFNDHNSIKAIERICIDNSHFEELYSEVKQICIEELDLSVLRLFYSYRMNKSYKNVFKVVRDMIGDQIAVRPLHNIKQYLLSDKIDSSVKDASFDMVTIYDLIAEGDFRSTFIKIEDKIDNQNVQAACLLGSMYKTGLHCERSYEKSLYYYRNSVDLGNTASNHDIREILNVDMSIQDNLNDSVSFTASERNLAFLMGLCRKSRKSLIFKCFRESFPKSSSLISENIVCKDPQELLRYLFTFTSCSRLLRYDPDQQTLAEFLQTTKHNDSIQPNTIINPPSSPSPTTPKSCILM